MRKKNLVKKVAAVHDMCGLGRVSLTAVIPILTTMGMQVNPLPTAFLSNHTQYPDFTFLDLTDEMQAIIDAWKRRDVYFDAIYSGYLGSARQIGIVEKFIADFRDDDTLVVIDPVLGDNGKLYAGFDAQQVVEMRRLIASADVITPNMTELFMLLDEPYRTDASDDEMKAHMNRLADQGPDTVIVTSVLVPGAHDKTATYAYSRSTDRYWRVICPYIPAHYPGTGDTFTSVLTGALLQGDSLPMAIDRAAGFILQGIRATFGYQHDNMEGILLEKVLPYLRTPHAISTYEWF